MISAATARPKPPGYTSVGVAAALYVPSFVRGHATHELTHKIRRSKVSREHDREFAELLAVAATRRFPEFQPDLIVSVPERPGADDRLRSIRTLVAGRMGAADAGRVLRQRWVVADYRQMTRAERREASAGRFMAQQPIDGYRVLLIDDVVTSGWQAREAIRALIAAGAGAWRFAAVARATAAPPEARAGPDGKREGKR
jgi:predicted amidophosphoribosyltransferase